MFHKLAKNIDYLDYVNHLDINESKRSNVVVISQSHWESKKRAGFII